MINYLNNNNSSDHYWYAVQCLPGKEKVVANALVSKFEANDTLGLVSAIAVSEETVQLVRNGIVVSRTRSKYPGYIYIKAKLTMFVKRNVMEGVKDPQTGKRLFSKFPGYNASTINRRVLSLKADEIANLGFIEEKTDSDSVAIAVPVFNTNDMVRIIEGPFNSFEGKVGSVNVGANTADVVLSIFGRPQNISVPVSILRSI